MGIQVYQRDNLSVTQNCDEKQRYYEPAVSAEVSSIIGQLPHLTKVGHLTNSIAKFSNKKSVNLEYDPLESISGMSKSSPLFESLLKSFNLGPGIIYRTSNIRNTPVTIHFMFYGKTSDPLVRSVCDNHRSSFSLGLVSPYCFPGPYVSALIHF